MGATGTAILDFGAFPGASDASVVVTGQASIVAGSLVEAWIRPVATADHTADEHMVETLKVFAHTIVAGTGFTISGFNTNQISEPVETVPGGNSVFQATATTVGQKIAQLAAVANLGGNSPRIYGQFTIAWAWN